MGKEQTHLLNWYKKLGKIRKELAVFKEGSYETIYSQDSVFIFQRYNEKEKVVVGVNRSDKPFQLAVTQLYEDVLHNEEVRNEYIIEPNEACLLVRKG